MAPRLPFSPPLSAKAAGILAVMWSPLVQSLTGLLGAALSGSLIVRHAVTVGLTYGVARFGFAARTRGAIALRLALGSICVAATQIAILLVTQPRYRAGDAVATLTLVASMLLPAVFVALYKAVLGWVVGGYVATPSFESADRAQIAASAWVLVGRIPYASFVFLAMILHFPATVMRAWGGMPSGSALVALVCFEGMAPVALATAAILRTRARRRWLSKVRAGDLPNWRLLEGPAPSEGLPHLVRADADELRTLVRVHDPAEPFREGERHEPVALVRYSN